MRDPFGGLTGSAALRVECAVKSIANAFAQLISSSGCPERPQWRLRCGGRAAQGWTAGARELSCSSDVRCRAHAR